jgi:hypothetical protein
MQADAAILRNMPGEPAGNTVLEGNNLSSNQWPALREFPMRFSILLLAWSCMVASPQQQSSWERIGELRVNLAHATWASPESLIRDLRSQDKAVRLKALRLVGTDANEEVFADAGPDEIELRYASLGEGRTKQAIVLVEAASYAYAAVAVPSLNAWERIAVFECWCKYEGSTLLDDFVRVEYTYHGIPDLILRASGGGTGLYEQTEARFALEGGEQRKVLSFISRRRTCPVGTNACLYERRWFISGQLVEAKATFEREQNVDWDLADAHNFKAITCTAYKWDASSFTDMRAGAAHPCKYEPSK